MQAPAVVHERRDLPAVSYRGRNGAFVCLKEKTYMARQEKTSQNRVDSVRVRASEMKPLPDTDRHSIVGLLPGRFRCHTGAGHLPGTTWARLAFLYRYNSHEHAQGHLCTLTSTQAHRHTAHGKGQGHENV